MLAGRVEPERLQDRLVLIGATAFGLSDYQATPVTDQMAGVEIHAQLLEGIFEGALLTRPPLARGLELAILAAAGLLLVFAVPRLRPRVSAALLLGVIVVVLALGFVAYRTRGLLVDAATPALGLAVLYTVMLGGHAHRDREPPARPAPPGRAAAGGGRAPRRRAGGGAAHPDGHAARARRSSSRPSAASISTPGSTRRGRWAAISTTSSSWTPITSSS